MLKITTVTESNFQQSSLALVTAILKNCSSSISVWQLVLNSFDYFKLAQFLY